MGQEKFFREALRPFVSVHRDFCKFSQFLVLEKLLEIFSSLRACSDLYAHTEHTGQELMRTLTIRISSPIS